MTPLPAVVHGHQELSVGSALHVGNHWA